MAETAAGIFRAVYPVTPALVDWLHNAELQPVEQCVFQYYRKVLPLQDLVQAVERGESPKYVALAALREYNDQGLAESEADREAGRINIFSPVTYEDLAQGNASWLFSDAGAWVIYTDHPGGILYGDHDDPEAAMTYAERDVEWIILWMPREEYAVVYRSPHTGRRSRLRETENDQSYESDLYAVGTVRGGVPAYVLPPEIEGALDSLTEDEVFTPYGIK